MSDQTKLFRRLELVTSLFIFISMLSVCSVITYHFYKAESQKRTQIEKSVEDYLLQSKSEIAEAMYFNLDEDLQLRERAIQQTVGNLAFVSLHRLESQKGKVGELSWKESTSAASQLSMPVFFGSKKVDDIRATLQWDARQMFMTQGSGIYLFLSLTIVISLLLWVLLFGQLRKRYLLPLMERAIERERVIATTDTAKMLAHDAKRPFNLLYSFLQSLEYVDDIAVIKDRIERTLPKAKKASDSLQELIDSTMENPSSQEFTLKDVYEIALCQLGDLSAGRLDDIDFHPEFDINLRGNRAEYVRIFQNIISNAIEATKVGNKIEVYAKSKRNILQISFYNEGSEIPEQVVSRIFRSGYSSKRNKARGEGLSSVKRIITKMHGTISAKSKDYKTIFTIELPITKSIQI